jgi:hypothetical protein
LEYLSQVGARLLVEQGHAAPNFNTLISESKSRRFATQGASMKFRMTKVLRFWVDVEYQHMKHDNTRRGRIELIAQILREFEEAGDAMRYLNSAGQIAWKATPAMLTSLADAEQEARDDWEE